MSAAERLVVATRNAGKLREFKNLLSGLSVVVVSLDDAGVGAEDEAEEHGATFTENAVAKALHYSRLTGGLALADDSGLVVDALGGEPGVRSARYGGPGLSDADRCRLLLDKMKGVPAHRRRARFVCVLALARAGAVEHPFDGATEEAVRKAVLLGAFEGAVEGVIASEPQGSGGFGYDPIFFYPPLGRTFAELTRGEKDSVSHRGAALRALRAGAGNLLLPNP